MSLIKTALNKDRLSTDNVLDIIYDYINDLMRKHKWGILNQEILNITQNITKIDLDILLGIATASLAGRGKIPCRGAFIQKCYDLYPEKELWKGL